MTSLNVAVQWTEQLTASHIPCELKHLRQNSDLRLCDRLFHEAKPDADGKEFLQSLNTDSLKVVMAYVEPSLPQAQPNQKSHCEHFGYFVADRAKHLTRTKQVLRRKVGLNASSGKSTR